MKLSLLVSVGLATKGGFAQPSVTDVAAKQRYPWNGLVDITVTLSGTEEECKDGMFTVPLYVNSKTTRAELPVRTVTANGAVTGEGNQWTRKLIWNAAADVGCAKFGEVELSVGTPISGGVQLWENGPYWAECNVGATQPEECGYYFWWGDTVGYKRNANNDGWISAKDSTGFSFDGGHCLTYMKGNSQLQLEGYIDETGNLAAAHDAAMAYFGVPWRMPTEGEFLYLYNNCTRTWETRNGVEGVLITGKGAYSSKSIFLPAAGCGDDSDLYRLGSYGDYWTSTPYSADSYSDSARSYSFYLGAFPKINYDRRYGGRSVRPVRGFVQ